MTKKGFDEDADFIPFDITDETIEEKPKPEFRLSEAPPRPREPDIIPLQARLQESDSRKRKRADSSVERGHRGQHKRLDGFRVNPWQKSYYDYSSYNETSRMCFSVF
jgi:hypothetical protein